MGLAIGCVLLVVGIILLRHPEDSVSSIGAGMCGFGCVAGFLGIGLLIRSLL